MSGRSSLGDTIAVASGRWRTPLRRVVVHGQSMVPALRDGDQLLAWMLPRPRAGVGAVVVADLPGGRGLAVKRIRMVRADGAIWLEGDNPFGSTDSRQFGPLPAESLRGRVLLRLWPRPGLVAARASEGPEQD